MSLGTGPFDTTELNQFGPLGSYWPVTFWEAVRHAFKIDPRVAALTEVYLRRTGPRFSYPCLIFSPSSVATGLDTGTSLRTEWDVQFSLLAEDDVAANTLGQAAYLVLAPKQATEDGDEYTRPKIWASDGVEMASIPGRENLVEQPGRSTNNKNVWAYQFTYRIFLIRDQLG